MSGASGYRQTAREHETKGAFSLLTILYTWIREFVRDF